jgi:hypothetical protein
MNKFFTAVFLFSFSWLTAQNSTLTRTYTIPGALGGGGDRNRTLVHGNSLYYITDGMGGMVIYKNNLDGIPVLTKSITAGYSNVFFNARNSNLYISGSAFTPTATVPFLINLDTASLNIIYSVEYSVSNYNSIPINDCIITSDNRMIMVGKATTHLAFADEYGVILNINLGANGSLAGTSTLSIANSTNTVIQSVTEISNSSLIFSAYSSGTPFIGKAVRSSAFYTTNSAYTYALSSDVKVAAFSNPKKFLAFDQNKVFKIDTNLALNNIPHPGVTSSQPASTKYIDNKVYRIIGSSLQIMDSSLIPTAINSYSTVLPFGSFYLPAISKSSANLFLVHSLNQTNNAFYMIKTDLAGQMNCSSVQTSTSSLTASNGGQASALTGSIASNFGFVNHSTGPINITHQVGCFSVGLAEKNPEPKKIRISASEGIYGISTDQAFKSAAIRDISGKCIYRKSDIANEFSANLKECPPGVYLIEIYFEDGTTRFAKLLH